MALDYYTMRNETERERKAKVTIGNFTVYTILTVSFAATIAYWYVLAGLEMESDTTGMWRVLLWLIVGVGIATELVKKVTLSTYRHTQIWLFATVVSVLTVMGTYKILDASRASQITQQSAEYQGNQAVRKEAQEKKQRHAWVANTTMTQLEQERDDIVAKRNRREMSYNNYLKQLEVVDKKITARRSYDSAENTLNSSSPLPTGSQDTESNPLLAEIAAVFGFSAALILSLFYLAVTILLEWAAFVIAGQVEERKNMMRLTEVEILDIKNREIFGISMAELRTGLYDKVRQDSGNDDRDPDPTGTDGPQRDGGYKESHAGFNSPTPNTANRNHSPRAQAQPTGQSSPQGNSSNVTKMENTSPTRAQSRANQAWGVHGNNAMKLDPILGTAEEQLPLPELNKAPETVNKSVPNKVTTLVDKGNNKPNKPQQGNQLNKGEQKPNSPYSYALQVIWSGIDKGDITRVSVSDSGQCQKALKAHKPVIGANNPERRELLDMVFDALDKEGVIYESKQWTGPKCGKQRWFINQNRTIRFN